MLDLDAYLDRIGLHGRPSLVEVHRAHATTIPFENLDPHRGVPVSLALEDLERKLVRERRGGYCFEQNLLLAGALEALGMEVELFLARVRRGAEPGVVRPRSHLVLRVNSEGASWHADVGFGLGTLLEPIPFGADAGASVGADAGATVGAGTGTGTGTGTCTGAEHEQAGWWFRVIQDGPELVLQTRQDGEWADGYSFLAEPAPMIDIEVSNWWVCTHPRSPFVTGIILGRHDLDGTRVSLNDWSGALQLVEQTPAGTVVTAHAREALPDLIASHFGLPGFVLGKDGRLGLASV